MELLLTLLAFILVSVGCFALIAFNANLANQVVVLAANNTDLSNELNIAIGRLEHLDHILKTKTDANRYANGELDKLLTIIIKIRKELKTAHDKVRSHSTTIDNLRNEFRELRNRLSREEF